MIKATKESTSDTETFFIIYLPLIGIQEVPNKTFMNEHIEWEGGRGFKTINDYGNFHLLRDQHQFSLKHHKHIDEPFGCGGKKILEGRNEK